MAGAVTPRLRIWSPSRGLLGRLALSCERAPAGQGVQHAAIDACLEPAPELRPKVGTMSTRRPVSESGARSWLVSVHVSELAGGSGLQLRRRERRRPGVRFRPLGLPDRVRAAAVRAVRDTVLATSAPRSSIRAVASLA